MVYFGKHCISTTLSQFGMVAKTLLKTFNYFVQIVTKIKRKRNKEATLGQKNNVLPD